GPGRCGGAHRRRPLAAVGSGDHYPVRRGCQPQPTEGIAWPAAEISVPLTATNSEEASNAGGVSKRVAGMVTSRNIAPDKGSGWPAAGLVLRRFRKGGWLVYELSDEGETRARGDVGGRRRRRRHHLRPPTRLDPGTARPAAYLCQARPLWSGAARADPARPRPP